MTLKAQNFVPNQGFEDAWSCPYSFVTLPVAKPYPQWINPNKGTPDQLHVCSTFDAGVPENFAGNMYPAEGAAYAGIILREVFYDTTRIIRGVSREYIQTKLIQPLERDKLYCVKLFYANSSKSSYAVDAMGITLTAENIGTKDAGLIIQRPQVINRPGHIMDNVDFWQELCGVYRAGGNEEYLTIGNFWDNALTNYKRNDFACTDSNFIYAYYYIDDVRVFEIDNTFECGCLNDLSFGTDWKADNFDPETGYNSLTAEDLASAAGINGNNGDNPDGNGNNNGNSNDNNGSNGNNSGQNSGDDNSNNLLQNSDSMRNSSIMNMKESEITNEAFNNVKIGDKFNLNRIFFEFNSSDLLTASFTELERLCGILNEKPSLRIEIRGHTDNIGSTSYNRSLSIKRAAAVYEYLLEKGIDKSRMKYRGFGNKVPIADNETDEGRRQNRRVEIIIVEL
jgi:outer membrane protein OmpA-like peptidoglycan-associated protein